VFGDTTVDQHTIMTTNRREDWTPGVPPKRSKAK